MLSNGGMSVREQRRRLYRAGRRQVGKALSKLNERRMKKQAHDVRKAHKRLSAFV